MKDRLQNVDEWMSREMGRYRIKVEEGTTGIRRIKQSLSLLSMGQLNTNL